MNSLFPSLIFFYIVGNSLALKISSTIAPAIKKVKDCIDEYNALAADPDITALINILRPLQADIITKCLKNYKKEDLLLLERMGLSITDKSAMWVQWCRATEETEILKGEICRLSSYTRNFEKSLNDALLKHPLSSLEQEKEKGAFFLIKKHYIPLIEDWNRRTADDLSQVLGTPMEVEEAEDSEDSDNDAYFNDE
ncbi:hypothetical protein BD770DRAFT_408703 [Pilaira anomala]|nr:hypothetical protein BD770DRAFT_408703 [Pilaira anomala]